MNAAAPGHRQNNESQKRGTFPQIMAKNNHQPKK